MSKRIMTILMLSLIMLGACASVAYKNYDVVLEEDLDNIKYAGVRSSEYGIEPFPGPAGWEKAITSMTDRFTGSQACAIWIVGTLHKNGTACELEFPSNGIEHPDIVYDKKDKHEKYLDYFDKNGIKVFLQVEPANAPVDTLIDIVLERYKHHPSVIGMGIDVEWHKEAIVENTGMKVNDSLAKAWEQQVKSYNSDYKMFLKHWDRNWMPPNYRGDIIFVDDSQMFDNFDHMMDEFINYWGDYFAPNEVWYQVGYPRDKDFWKKLEDPPSAIGKTIAKHIDQEMGIMWVDFTLTDVLPVE